MKSHNKNYASRHSLLLDEIKKLPDIEVRLAARHIINRKLPRPLWADGIAKDSKRHVKTVFGDIDNLTLALARQASLLCHFPNFDEKTLENRTRLTFLSKDSVTLQELEEKFESIVRTGIMGNLPEHCNVRFFAPKDGKLQCLKSLRENSYLDTGIDLIASKGCSQSEIIPMLPDADSSIITVFSYEDLGEARLPSPHVFRLLDRKYLSKDNIEKYFDEIDFTRALLINKVYNISTGLREITNFTSFDASDYNVSLKRLCDEISESSAVTSWDSIQGNDALEVKLSNLYCGDCIDAKLASVGLKIEDFVKKEKAGLLSALSFQRKIRKSHAMKVIENHLKTLSKVEHYRWCAERLILGYQPFSKEEHYEDELLSIADRKEYRRRKKRDLKHHIDLCSYKELRHVDPEAIKYDCFITLAIDRILTLEQQFRQNYL